MILEVQNIYVWQNIKECVLVLSRYLQLFNQHKVSLDTLREQIF